MQPPHAISPLIEVELWEEDQTNPWDVLSPMVPDLTSLGHILTPPGSGGELFSSWGWGAQLTFANVVHDKKKPRVPQI